ncbi:MAG: hypothetical protein ACKOEY_15865, partial [Phenylobacterium sp.]
PGSGEDVAVDDINGVNFPLVKLAHGPENTAQDVTYDTPLPVDAGGGLLRAILQVLLSPLGYDKVAGRQKVSAVVESGTVTTVQTVNSVTGVTTVNSVTGVTTVTTVSSLTNLAGVGGFPAQMPVIDQNRAAWALAVRSRIT